MTRDDLKIFSALDIDFESIGLLEPGVWQEPYFCDPVGCEHVGRLGCDGVHFILLPGEEQVYCVDPAMGEPGTYVLPVAEDFRAFLSFLLFCRDANPISQIWWLEESRFRKLLKEDAEACWGGSGAYFTRKAAALRTISETFAVEPKDPYHKVKALQMAFDPSVVCFSDAYYDVLGLDAPDDAC